VNKKEKKILDSRNKKRQEKKEKGKYEELACNKTIRGKE
jgi:hypothetical protein